MPNNTGKAGTITVDEFDSLSDMAATYSETVLASKVGKILDKKAGVLLHECSTSLVGAAYRSVSGKLTTAVGTSARKISKESFDSLSSMVERYGAEVITWKLAKLAKRNERTADAALLKGIFPRSAS